jgi:prolyl 4-hydroxylase
MLVQKITPQIIEWVRAQARAGHARDAVLQAMRGRGWDDHIALAAISEAHNQKAEEIPAPIPVPEPDTAHGTSYLRLPDRTVQVLTELQLPRLCVFGGFLGADECDGLVELARDRLVRSEVVDAWSGGGAVNVARTSEGMFFERGENEIVARIEARVAELLKWPVDRGEGLQVLRYRPGGEYQPHHDYLSPALGGDDRELRHCGQRVATLLMYLSDVESGGATTFPDAGLRVLPIKGNAAFFSYDRPHPMTRTLHAGAPVLAGEKWIATKWLRERAFSQP